MPGTEYLTVEAFSCTLIAPQNCLFICQPMPGRGSGVAASCPPEAFPDGLGGHSLSGVRPPVPLGGRAKLHRRAPAANQRRPLRRVSSRLPMAGAQRPAGFTHPSAGLPKLGSPTPPAGGRRPSTARPIPGGLNAGLSRRTLESTTPQEQPLVSPKGRCDDCSLRPTACPRLDTSPAPRSPPFLCSSLFILHRRCPPFWHSSPPSTLCRSASTFRRGIEPSALSGKLRGLESVDEGNRRGRKTIAAFVRSISDRGE